MSNVGNATLRAGKDLRSWHTNSNVCIGLVSNAHAAHVLSIQGSFIRVYLLVEGCSICSLCYIRCTPALCLCYSL